MRSNILRSICHRRFPPRFRDYELRTISSSATCLDAPPQGWGGDDPHRKELPTYDASARTTMDFVNESETRYGKMDTKVGHEATKSILFSFT